jgi:hypothetical protein
MIELASRIYSVNEYIEEHGYSYIDLVTRFPEGVRAVFDVLKGRIVHENLDGVRSDDLCGTHVHISLEPTPWSEALGKPAEPAKSGESGEPGKSRKPGEFGPLKRLAIAILFWERCIDVLMPPSHLNNEYCKSNYASFYDAEVVPSVRKQGLPGWTSELYYAYEKIDEATTVGGIEGIMNHQPRAFKDPQSPPRHSWFRWNFVPVLYDNMETVEFRQPPISENANEAIGWVYFALGFVRAAVTWDMQSGVGFQGREATVVGLREFVIDGMGLCGLVDGPEFQAVFPRDLRAKPSDLVWIPTVRPGAGSSS